MKYKSIPSGELAVVAACALVIGVVIGTVGGVMLEHHAQIAGGVQREAAEGAATDNPVADNAIELMSLRSERNSLAAESEALRKDYLALQENVEKYINEVNAYIQGGGAQQQAPILTPVHCSSYSYGIENNYTSVTCY